MNSQPWPFPTAASHPKPGPEAAPQESTSVVQKVSETCLDHAIEESFPASDPVSVVATKVVPADEASAAAGKDSH